VRQRKRITEPVGLPITVIRGGSSRGVFVRAEDLPRDPSERDAVLMRLFAGESRTLADGLGGESAVLRKIAVVSPDDAVVGRLRYEFAQVTENLTQLDRTVECGNIASGVPLFGAICGWSPSPEPEAGVSVLLANTGQVIRTEWIEYAPSAGRLKLFFPARTAAAPTPLGEAISVFSGRGRPVRYSVVRGTNTYLIVDSRDLGLRDPLDDDAGSGAVFDTLQAIADQVLERLGTPVTLKVCAATRASDSGAIRARIYYLRERATHPGFAVTGATAVALSQFIAGSVLHDPRGTNDDVVIQHPSGDIRLGCVGEAGDLPAEFALERSCRLIARGSAF